MTDTIEQLTDNELRCWIRYLWHRLEALRYYPGPIAEHDQEWWEGLLQEHLQEALVRKG